MNKRYTTALDEAINWIKSNYSPKGIVVSGSIIRGNPNHNSDFDIYVIHTADFKQRVLKLFNDVPCEIFICNIEQVHKYFEQELTVNRPSAANMLATGVIYEGTDDVEILQLIEDAKLYTVQPVLLTTEKEILFKYSIATFFEDATDVIDNDKATAAYILDMAMSKVIEYAFAKMQLPLPRIKERLKILEEINPDVAKEIGRYFNAGTVTEKYTLAKGIIYNLTGHLGFFEWSSPRE